MKKLNLNCYKRGWIAGSFEPAIFSSKDMEVGIKKFTAGETERKHYHKLFSEMTLIISGRVKMNGIEYYPDDIILLEPGEATDFECLDDAVTCVVRNGSSPQDKYEVPDAL